MLMRQKLTLFLLCWSACSVHANSSSSYSLLDPVLYKLTVSKARAQAQFLLARLAHYRHQDLNSQLAFIVKELADTPYLYPNSTGEGDWQTQSSYYSPNAIHLRQYPVYRFDGLDCQSFVQVVMALIYANSLPAFESTLISIAYGAAGNPNGEKVRYYNRNHFIEADFNPINQGLGLIKDVTSRGQLAAYHREIKATISRQAWFMRQQKESINHIAVLKNSHAQQMIKRFNTVYSKLNFPHFDKQTIAISYIPKERLILQNIHGEYEPNNTVLDKVPTPALVEFVRDPRKWHIHKKKIKDIIGTELTVSHFGVLYRQTFKYGEIIYHQIKCYQGNVRLPTCQVNPVICRRKSCPQLMFAHATNAHPKSYIWHKNSQGQFACQIPQPGISKNISTCNRVEILPLYHYLTDKHDYMQDKSLVGIHVEQLLTNHLPLS